MCTRLKLNRGIITPGMIIQYELLTASKQGKFGLYGGKIPNVRDDRLKSTWGSLYHNNRAIITVESFEEKGHSFVSPTGHLVLAAVYDLNGDIAIVTRDATPLVAQVHNRMPMILPGDFQDMWLRHGAQWTQNYSALQLVSL